MIQLSELGYTYPRADRPAVSEISLEAVSQSVTVIAGESGSGKTTLLRLIAGFQLPSVGTIHMDGRVVSQPGRGVPPERRGVGMVFQDFALFPHLTVSANVGFGLRTRGWAGRRSADERRRRVHDSLARVGLTDLAERYPHELSGGQAQRVAIARALAPEPAVLVMDEPFNNLDVALRHELVPEVARLLRETGTTTIVVTHNAEEAFELADTMLVIRDGRAEQVGPPRELYEQPRTRYVAHFFGAVNEIDGDHPVAKQALVLGFPVTEQGGVVIQPHQFELRRDDQNGQVLRGIVSRVRFFGDHSVAVVTTDTLSAPVRVHLPQHGVVAPGDAVSLSLRASSP